MHAVPPRLSQLILASLISVLSLAAHAEPDPKTYWEVTQVRPGMKGIGWTVMVGTKLEKFDAEVLGVMRDVSPGRDMILCRLQGCNLEHAGIIQGMSGSPIYIDGKLLGAVAFAWEFAKDPIAGVTPFEQMVKYIRSGDRRLAAEKSGEHLAEFHAGRIELPLPLVHDRETASLLPLDLPHTAATAGVGEMRPIATPLAATSFGPRGLALLNEQLGPYGMAPVAGGGVLDDIRQREGDKPLAPGSPLSIAMVTGDFDLSGIGTVTHVEGDRVFGFGHPMLGLGACELPMMTGYIHTVYPRASVSMKMGSPLKVVGVLDTDVSTGIAGRIGPKPDMLPMSVKVQTGRYSDPRTYNVQIARHPKLVSGLVLSVLSNAIDTEGDLPDDLTVHLSARIEVEGRDPIEFKDTVSGPRFSGPMGPSALFGPVGAIVGVLTHNAIGPVRVSRIDCDVAVDFGRTTASIDSVRLISDRLQPGDTLKAIVTLEPYQARNQTIELALPLPADMPEGNYEATICDATQSLRKRINAAPQLSEARDLNGLLAFLRLQAELKRTGLFVHVPRPERGLAIEGQALPNLPASARAVLSDSRQTAPMAIKTDLVQGTETKWVVEGSQSIKFQVVKDTQVTARE